MNDFSQYLLRTPRQIGEFRFRYAGWILSQGDAFVGWIRCFPPREWMDYLSGVPKTNIPAVIGIICILYIDRRIDIDFNDTATRIRRNWTPEEFEQFWKLIKTPKPKNEK